MIGKKGGKVKFLLFDGFQTKEQREGNEEECETNLGLHYRRTQLSAHLGTMVAVQPGWPLTSPEIGAFLKRLEESIQ